PIPDLSLKTDDALLRYAYYRERIAGVWAKGVWHKQYDLAATEADGGGCQSDCNSVVIKNGVKEWCVQITNSSGHTGWGMSLRLNHDDFWDDATSRISAPTKVRSSIAGSSPAPPRTHRPSANRSVCSDSMLPIPARIRIAPSPRHLQNPCSDGT